jgi:hypothetical protein
MIEILINENDWKSIQKIKRLTEIIDKLKNSGWERFGHNGTIVLFKDTSKDRAKNELIQLGINEIEAEEWEEDLYSNNIF